MDKLGELKEKIFKEHEWNNGYALVANKYFNGAIDEAVALRSEEIEELTQMRLKLEEQFKVLQHYINCLPSEETKKPEGTCPTCGLEIMDEKEITEAIKCSQCYRCGEDSKINK